MRNDFLEFSAHYAPQPWDVIDTPCGTGIVVSVRHYRDDARAEDVRLLGLVLESGDVAHVLNCEIAEPDPVYSLLGRCSTQQFVSALLYYTDVLSRDGVEVPGSDCPDDSPAH